MGLTQSRNYPSELTVEGPQAYTFTNESDSNATGFSSNETAYKPDNDLRYKQIDSLFKKMSSNLKMYMLYDNFDTKNEVILGDLKKKATNQEKELKELVESRDKLMAEFTSKKDETNNSEEKENNMDIINYILGAILLLSIVFIIYKIYTYPLEGVNNNNVSINKLLDLENTDLNNLSVEELNNLEKIFDAKINRLEQNINSSNNVKSNSSNSSNLSNSLNLNKKKSINLNSVSNNSVNNITNSNLKKRNKLTL